MLTLFQKYQHHQSQNSKTWDRKCLALHLFTMNPKVRGSSPSQVETFSVSRTSTLSQEHPFVCRKWMLLPAQILIMLKILTFYLAINMIHQARDVINDNDELHEYKF